jgi:hypothetical protein
MNKYSLIGCDQIIYNEISFLARWSKEYPIKLHDILSKFFHILLPCFKDLLRKISVDFKVEPVFSWYPSLCRHKSQYHFNPFQKTLFQN